MIGLFDSGVGGLSVLTEVRAQIPDADLLYVADRERAPYGPRPLDEVRDISRHVSSWLINQGCDTVVIACNTASAAAIEVLRAEHPEVPFVGMEPAVKPAALSSRNGVIAVFATEATIQGRLFESLLARHGSEVEVIEVTCPEWVELVESGQLDNKRARESVAKHVVPALERGADTLVLGCSHFSFLQPLIREIAGNDVDVIDPAPAVAAQTRRVATTTEGSGRLVMAASGDPTEFEGLAATLAKLDTVSPALPFPS